MKCKNPFCNMVYHALFGAVLGLIAGLIFGWIIYGIGTFFYKDEVLEGLYFAAPFFGMGAGTLVGAIMGAIIGIKKTK